MGYFLVYLIQLNHKLYHHFEILVDKQIYIIHILNFSILAQYNDH
jgi:hypothetical protein